MIIVGATLAAFVCDREDTSQAWLYNAENLAETHDVQFFAALEVDARGLEPFTALIQRLKQMGGEYWTYSYDDGRTEVTTVSRLPHICMGRNIIQDRAISSGATHVLHLDADTELPNDAIPRLLEMDHGIVGGHVPTYCLSGPVVPHAPWCEYLIAEGTSQEHDSPGLSCGCNWKHWNVQQHMNTAGFLLVRRDIFKRIRWRVDLEAGMTDDPCYELDCRELLGMPTYVRHDLVAQHYPTHILPIENRFDNRDRRVQRNA